MGLDCTGITSPDCTGGRTISPLAVPVPLLPSQIAAAHRIYALTTQWQHTQRAFELLRERVPGFDLAACLLKVAAVNQLYGTNVYAVGRMAEHVAGIMAAPPDDLIDLVEMIACLPPAEGQKQTHRHWSFASKFAHFFVDDRIPIYDWYVWEMVRFHLGAGFIPGDPAKPYRSLAENLARLRSLFGITCSAGELDCYLWLAGVYREWQRKGPIAQINAEAKAMFENPTPEVKRALLEMAPPG